LWGWYRLELFFATKLEVLYNVLPILAFCQPWSPG
jgi:hypothetical protein